MTGSICAMVARVRRKPGGSESPFVIAAAPYGGAGFLDLLATARELMGFSTSLEFGGAVLFAFGPLRDHGRVWRFGALPTPIMHNSVRLNLEEFVAIIADEPIPYYVRTLAKDKLLELRRSWRKAKFFKYR